MGDPCQSAEPQSSFLHVRRARWRIVATYALTGVENGFDLLYPLLIGMAINGLLGGDRLALVPLAGLWSAHIVVAAVRQLYDTRLFARLHADVATEMTMTQRAAGKASGEISARVDMAREFVDFLEMEVPQLATVLFSLVGGVVLLLVYDPVSGGIIAGLLLPVAAINFWLARRAFRLNRAINDQQERQVEVISLGLLRGLKRHFGRIVRWRIHISNADAAAWSAAELLTMAAVLAVIWRLAGLPGANAGDIFAGVAYLLRIIDALDHVPTAMQQIGRLADIRRRVTGR